MKKFIFFILFILIFHIGCASLKPERNVVNNQFVSTYPKIKIKIMPEFAYIESISKSGYAEGIEAARLTHSADSYAFVEAEKATSEVKKAITIQISTTGGRYIRDFYRGAEKTALDYGKLEIGDKEYRYFTRIGTPTAKGYLTKHIYEKGFTMSCGLIKVCGRLIGSDNVLTQIIYYEDIKNSGLSCRSWKYKQSLTESHIQYLEGYNQRFKSSFEILEQ
jgi:hypothetical protein